MCNEYQVGIDLAALAEHLDAHTLLPFDWANPIHPRRMAPGLLLSGDGERELHPMQFAFSPPGCKTPSDPKRTLNNARIESCDKWPWKQAFQSSRCIVPLTSFREPCYWGEDTEGKQIDFHKVGEGTLGVASIYRRWRSEDKQQEVITMSFLMRPAPSFVMDRGHHRMPFFLHPDGYDAWMSAETRDAGESKRILKEFALEPELSTTVGRQMADAWKSRQSGRVKQRDEQLREIEEKGPLGF